MALTDTTYPVDVRDCSPDNVLVLLVPAKALEGTYYNG